MASSPAVTGPAGSIAFDLSVLHKASCVNEAPRLPHTLVRWAVALATVVQVWVTSTLWQLLLTWSSTYASADKDVVVQGVANAEFVASALAPVTNRAPTILRSGTRDHPSRGLEVKLAPTSEVCFFCADGEISERPTCRALRMKHFDGPSGHKSKRLLAVPGDGGSALRSDSETDDEFDFEDECDEIAELMCHPRHLLLWSNSW